MKSDLCCICGLMMIGGGLWMLSPPVAVITVGAVLLSLGVVSARQESSEITPVQRKQGGSKF